MPRMQPGTVGRLQESVSDLRMPRGERLLLGRRQRLGHKYQFVLQEIGGERHAQYHCRTKFHQYAEQAPVHEFSVMLREGEKTSSRERAAVRHVRRRARSAVD